MKTIIKQNDDVGFTSLSAFKEAASERDLTVYRKARQHFACDEDGIDLGKFRVFDEDEEDGRGYLCNTYLGFAASIIWPGDIEVTFLPIPRDEAIIRKVKNGASFKEAVASTPV